MKAPAHITGGIFFAGFFASLWSINIFSSIWYFAAVIIGALLPDIDHTRSVIGKFFYPLAKWIDKRFGHRTITHSLIFLVFILITSLILEYFLNAGNHNLSVILFFSVLSHYLLDMITLLGIPLFYPFKRNPCVIPGNPDMRIETGNTRAELAAFFIFSVLIFSAYDLFANGFWTQYNRMFGTIKHVYYEFQGTTNLLEVNYSYHSNAEPHQGNALLLYATETNLTLYENGDITELSTQNKYQRIDRVQAAKTPFQFIENKLIFINISADSLNRLLSQNLITGEIQSNYEFTVNHDNISKNGKNVKFERRFSPAIITAIDTANVEKQKQLKIKQLRLQEQQIIYASKLKTYKNQQQKINQLARDIENAPNLYERNKLEKELIQLKSQKNTSLPPDQVPNLVLQEEIKTLETEIKQGKALHLFSGYISYPVIPENYKSLKNEKDNIYASATD